MRERMMRVNMTRFCYLCFLRHNFQVVRDNAVTDQNLVADIYTNPNIPNPRIRSVPSLARNIAIKHSAGRRAQEGISVKSTRPYLFSISEHFITVVLPWVTKWASL